MTYFHPFFILFYFGIILGRLKNMVLPANQPHQGPKIYLGLHWRSRKCQVRRSAGRAVVALWGGSRGWPLAACRMRARTRGRPLWACAAALKCPLAGLFHLGAGPARAARWRAPVLWICAESHAPRTALAGHVQLGPVVCPRKAPQIPQPAPYSQPPQTRSMPCCLESWAGAAVRTLRVGGWFVGAWVTCANALQIGHSTRQRVRVLL